MSIVVLGSANLDLVYEVDRIPRPGETLLASGSAQHAGGKGNNQASAAGRAGGVVSFIAAVGQDEAAETILAELRRAQVKDLVRRVPATTGTAFITVSHSGQNAIVVNSGANAWLTDLTDDESDAITGANILLLQLEIPLETVIAGAKAARNASTLVVLNAAPIRALPPELLHHVDVLVVNEHEARLINEACDPDQSADITVAEATLLAGELLRLVPTVIITLGSQGAIVQNRQMEAVHVPGEEVHAVDTTGAGDTFCGALATALDEIPTGSTDSGLVSAVRFATAAATLSVQRAGAGPSIPSRKEIDHFRSPQQLRCHDESETIS